nr:MAG TPA: hypothetical protein [Caudoviricetes sp.]
MLLQFSVSIHTALLLTSTERRPQKSPRTEHLARLLTGGLNLRASWLKNFQNELDS